MPPSFVLELEEIVRQQKGAWVRLAQMHDIVYSGTGSKESAAAVVSFSTMV